MSATSPVHFSAELRPHRSLNRRGLVLVMSLVLGINLVVGIAFGLVGAWPVAGFCGLDVVLIGLAFHFSYRAARDREHLLLSDAALVVRRITAGRVAEWQFHPYWVRLRHDDEALEAPNSLTLSSHGTTLAIGRFLSPPERRSLALDLNVALSRHRSAPG